jgi:hypothetical protein
MAARLLAVIGWNALAWSLLVSSIVGAAEPRVTDNRYKLELVASDPQIVTPIGLAFDRKGRMLVIESPRTWGWNFAGHLSANYLQLGLHHSELV